MTRRGNTFGKRGGGGRREHERLAAGLPAYLVSLSSRHRAILINISQTGARMRVEDPPKRGSDVFLRAHGLDVLGRIVWKSGEMCGLRFDQELRMFDVEQVRHEAALGVRERLSPEQKGGADDWQAGLAR